MTGQSDRDRLAEAIGMGLQMWSMFGPAKAGTSLTEFLADWLIENRAVDPQGGNR